MVKVQGSNLPVNLSDYLTREIAKLKAASDKASGRLL
jgi:hypothetical protein